MKREFPTADGRIIALDIPEPRAGQSVYVVAGHKTGSVLLTNIIHDLAEATGLPAVPVEGSVWREGFAVKDWPASLYALLEEDGYVFYSFRWLQKLPGLAAFADRRKLFMIRDPRDVAVSYYFSMARSHGLPKTGSSRDTITALRKEAGAMGIDEFVQAGKAGPILRNIERFAEYLEDPAATFYRYEDVIFAKRDWVAQIAGDLGIALPEQALQEIADRHDIVPDKEAPDKHIRSVRPGGYREKLSPESQDYIREHYPAFFQRYGYS